MNNGVLFFHGLDDTTNDDLGSLGSVVHGDELVGSFGRHFDLVVGAGLTKEYQKRKEVEVVE